MKRLFLIFALFSLPLAYALGLEEALQAAASRPDAINARLELLTYQNDRLRVDGDPLALKLDRVKADQAVRLGRATLHQAIADGLVDIAGAYTRALEARAQSQLADEAVALSRTGFRIAEIRRDNGTGTVLDVQDAQVSLEAAQQDAVAAHDGLAIALDDLQGMTATDVTAAELVDVPDAYLVEVPALAQVTATLEGHPRLLQARQGLELARLGVEMLDPSYASAAQIESAKTQLLTTEQLVDEAARGFSLQARNLVNQAERAAKAYAIEVSNLANARQRLAFQQERLANGLISQLQFDQARLSTQQAELAALRARDAALRSLLALQAGTLVPLDGPTALDAAQGLPAQEADHAKD